MEAGRFCVLLGELHNRGMIFGVVIILTVKPSQPISFNFATVSFEYI